MKAPVVRASFRPCVSGGDAPSTDGRIRTDLTNGETREAWANGSEKQVKRGEKGTPGGPWGTSDSAAGPPRPPPRTALREQPADTQQGFPTRSARQTVSAGVRGAAALDWERRRVWEKAGHGPPRGPGGRGADPGPCPAGRSPRSPAPVARAPGCGVARRASSTGIAAFLPRWRVVTAIGCGGRVRRRRERAPPEPPSRLLRRAPRNPRAPRATGPGRRRRCPASPPCPP